MTQRSFHLAFCHGVAGDNAVLPSEGGCLPLGIRFWPPPA
ncbi:hypothetical protein SAMN00790413_05835 [Deinococcus hopiensis KR-140]|uniref:Uncharacterized protein n=1 Tax=Deinococcus hopiensis KR-140 TaxID=695939 RepID=A0A1W1UDQ8_9DEIO|nr:hypothetical protein SAMN00790413_05835 [Deinococcus hopiensis KR-140]